MSTETTVSSMNLEADNNASVTPESLPSAEVESSLTLNDSPPILENMNESPVTNLTNESAVVAESPAAKGRSPKQQKADEGAAEILKRMRGLYNTEFADIPVGKRPKPPAWAARAALYKSPEEREDYIQDMVRNTRNSLMNKSSPMNNAGLGNNSDVLMGQLMTALETATRVARQLKNTTRKHKKSPSMNVNANSNMGSMNDPLNSNMGSMNTGNYANTTNAVNSMNTNNNNNVPRTSFTRSKRVSPLSARKSKKAKKSLYNEPPMSF